MKKWQWIVGTGAVTLGIAGAAMAANISNLSGQSCGDSVGNWHFVNNRIPAGSGTGTLSAMWSSGNTCVVTASAVNSSTQHFNCIAAGTLLTASTNLGGKLVLSHFTCGTPPPPPPECDPKTDPKCEPTPPK
jgi:hypothetical protein